MRGRVVSTLKEYDELALDELGPRVRVDYTDDGEYGRTWLRDLVDALEDDGLVVTDERADGLVASLRR
jgi:A/G-specific adenine glycosylase